MIKLVVLALIFIVAIFFHEELSILLDSPLAIKQFIQSAGWSGILLFVIVFVCTQPFGIPGFVFVLAASLIWPAGIAFLISWFAGTLASIAGFLLARWLGYDFAERRIPARFQRLKTKFSAYTPKNITILFLMFYLAPPLSWFLGLTSTPLKIFTMGAVIGLLPVTLLLSISGPNIIAFIAGLPTWLMVCIACLLLALITRQTLIKS